MTAGMIDGETILAAQAAAENAALHTIGDRLAAAAIAERPAERCAWAIADVLQSERDDPRAMIAEAFLHGMILGARCARLVP